MKERRLLVTYTVKANDATCGECDKLSLFEIDVAPYVGSWRGYCGLFLKYLEAESGTEMLRCPPCLAAEREVRE